MKVQLSRLVDTFFKEIHSMLLPKESHRNSKAIQTRPAGGKHLY